MQKNAILYFVLYFEHLKIVFWFNNALKANKNT